MKTWRVSLSERRKSACTGRLALVALALFSWNAGAQTIPPRATENPQQALSCNVADGFTLAAVGDLIVDRPISGIQDEGFLATSRILRETDAAFGNMEGTLIDIRHFDGYPQAETDPTPLLGVPEIARDLRAMGIRLVSRANNHTTDWGIEGMRQTDKALDEAGVVHAGTGQNRALARAARFLDTPKGRVGIVSMASSFAPMSVSTMPLGEMPGRPGLNALRTTEWELVTPDMFESLRKIRDAAVSRGAGVHNARGRPWRAANRLASGGTSDPRKIATALATISYRDQDRAQHRHHSRRLACASSHFASSVPAATLRHSTPATPYVLRFNKLPIEFRAC